MPPVVPVPSIVAPVMAAMVPPVMAPMVSTAPTVARIPIVDRTIVRASIVDRPVVHRAVAVVHGAEAVAAVPVPAKMPPMATVAPPGPRCERRRLSDVLIDGGLWLGLDRRSEPERDGQ